MSAVLKAFPDFKFGCDPELVLLDKNDNPISADGLIPGTKYKPYKVSGGAVQVDGMAAEFNIDPAESYREFSDNIDSVLSELKKMLPKGVKFAALPAVRFSPEVFAAAHPRALELGCDPDFNAWTGNKNRPPRNRPDDPFLRTFAGHVHIGWRNPTEDTILDPTHISNCNDLVRQLDWYLGAWSVLKDPGTDRRRLYGRAGACRYKPYGVEYRVLSNFWVLSKQLRLEMWNRLQRAIYDMEQRFMEDVTGGVLGDILQKSINRSEIEGISTEYPYPILTISQK